MRGQSQSSQHGAVIVAENDAQREIDAKIGDCYYKIGYAEQYLGNGDEALKNYDLSLVHRRVRYPREDHYSCAEAHNKMGELLRQRGKHEEAIEHFCAGERIVQADATRDAKLVLADIYGNRGVVCDEKSQFERALDYYTRSLRLKSECHNNDENHISLAITNQNIAIAYRRQGKLEDAVRHFDKSLEIMKLHYQDENHYKLAGAYMNIAIARQQQKAYAESLKMYQKSLQIGIKYYGEGNQNIAKTYYNLGTLYAEMKDFAHAAQNMHEAHKIFQKYWKDDNSMTKTALELYNYYKKMTE